MQIFISLTFVIGLISCLLTIIFSLISFGISKYELSKKLNTISLVSFIVLFFSYILSSKTFNLLGIMVICILLFLIIITNFLLNKHISATMPLLNLFETIKSFSYKRKILITVSTMLIILSCIYFSSSSKQVSEKNKNTTDTSAVISKNKSAEFVLYAVEYNLKNNTFRLPGKTLPKTKIYVSSKDKEEKQLISDENGKFEINEKIPMDKTIYYFKDQYGHKKTAEIKTKQILAEEDDYWKTKQEELKHPSSSINENTMTTSSTTESTSSYSIENNTSTSKNNANIRSKDDITNIVPSPTVEQKAILNELAQTQFERDFPYEGSKIHTWTGMIKNWTQEEDHWFYAAKATVVNAYGAKRRCTVEIRITPTSSNSGFVEIIDY
ncbi:hypothetical protein [Enterococcus faecalis]|uniref:hypothetical protein n=1 Tax=Enterococcus faecalis TaxID=1351 RepID=UPI0039A676C1